MGVAGSALAQITVSASNTTLINTNTAFFNVAGAAPVGNTRYVDLKEGSPFFQDNWSKSRIVTQDGKVYQDVSIKLNLLENRVYYMDTTGKELVVGVPLKEIQLQQTSGVTIHFVHGSLLPGTKQGWYQLLVNNTLSLFKRFTKSIEQHTSYGSAPELSIKTLEDYLVLVKGQEYSVKKPVDFTKIFPDKKAAIEKESKKLNDKLSREAQLSAMAMYCQTLL